MENKTRMMKAKIINCNVNNVVDQAKQIIIEGGIIVYPTDTIYGFGVDATNTLAIQKLNQLKNRAQPLSIIINSIYEIKN